MMNISSPAVLGALRALGVVIIMAVLQWLGDSTHLAGVLNPAVNSIVAMIAMSIENSMANNSGKAMFGAINTQK